jgi:hypothetical protein
MEKKLQDVSVGAGDPWLVSDLHVSAKTEQGGWAINFNVDSSTGLMASFNLDLPAISLPSIPIRITVHDSTDGSAGRTAAGADPAGADAGFGGEYQALTPSGIMFIGEGVKGFALFMQVGRKYVALNKCSYAPSYSCGIEFHRIDNLKDLGLEDHRETDGKRILVQELDFGVAQPDASKTGSCPKPPCSGSTDADRSGGPSGSPDHDARKTSAQKDDQYAKKGDRRQSRPKRTTAKGATKKAGPGKKVGGGGKKSMPSSPSSRADVDKGLTLSTKIRVPYGAEAISYTFTANTNHFMFVFSSASQFNLDVMLKGGKDMEDSIHYMTTPAVANVPPNAWLNNLYVKYKFQ